MKRWTNDGLKSAVKDRDLVARMIVQSLFLNDMDAIQDILISLLRYSPNKDEIAKRAKIGRRTLYNLLDKDRRFNPTMETLGALLKEIAA